jgi:predicted ATPase
LAQAYAESGQLEVAQQVFAEALAVTERSGELWWQPELYRLRGELLLMPGGDPAAAEHCFRSAIELARRQQSRSLELRAAVSLCRMLASCGETREAQGLVAGVLARITGGDTTRDVREATAALEPAS